MKLISTRRKAAHAPFPMLTPAEAERLILEHMPPFLREDCPLSAATGRVLRAEVRADRDLPPFDRVTMDGYALRSAALAAGVRTFRIRGVQAAGMRPFKLDAGDDVCLEIMTGAVLPTGADCVVPLEDTRRTGVTMTVTAPERFAAGHALHGRGADRRAGEVVLRAGTRIGGREVAVAAAVGAGTLTVSASPRIAVVATGDELVEVEGLVAPHQIRRSNDHALRAVLLAAGYPRVERFHLRDVRHEIAERLREILAAFDVVIVTGGVSKGKFDFLPVELEAQGVARIFHGVAQRPGKPLWFGASARGVPVFALPGNPVSAFVCLHRYVLPALAHASGETATRGETAALAEAVELPGPLTCFLPVKRSNGPRAEALIAPVPTHTSGDFSSLVGTDGFVELPAGATAFPAGYVARYFSW
jgi:molybdopterin molybdotransferase